MSSRSLCRRLAFNLSLLLVLQACCFWAIVEFALPLLPALLTCTLLAIGLVHLATLRFLQPIVRIVRALEVGVAGFKDRDFGITIHDEGYAELGRVIAMYNELATTLRQERMSIHQRELLLDTVIQSTPVALLLTDDHDVVVYGNRAAKQLLGHPGKLVGHGYSTLARALPPALQAAALEARTGLTTELIDGESQIFDLQIREFTLHQRRHRLYLFSNLTAEISRKEIDIWKSVIRLISHELNNSLAPISSLVHSGHKVIDDPSRRDMLAEIFETIARRCKHLQTFIEQYASYVRLPPPQPRSNNLAEFFADITRICAVEVESTAALGCARFDAGQIEQMLINLVKNARESGSEPDAIAISVDQAPGHLSISVVDRGPGMDEDRRKQAILPFFTTKSKGTGIGLPLCTEIMRAHGGKLRLSNREGGGLEVRCWMPQ